MRLVLFDRDTPRRINFSPVALSRPIWELRVGMSSLADKLVAKTAAADVACFVPEYMADSYRAKTDRKVNDPTTLAGTDLLLVNPRVRAESFDISGDGASEVGLDAEGEVLWARVTTEDAAKLKTDSIEAFLAGAVEQLPNVPCELPTWDYTWDLVLANSSALTVDFAAAGRGGVDGTVEQPNAVRGSEKDIYIAPGATVHPMVVLDADNGPIYIDEDAEIHPFTRIEGPCYIGRKSILFGAKCREGMSIGPVCRVGGEVEESIIHGHSNKYHDGFLGHAYVGAMALILATGRPLPKFIPSFAWFMEGAVTKGYGKSELYKAAKVAMSRRKCEWTDTEEAMWDAIFERTSPQRDVAVRRGRLQLMKK